MTQGASQQVAQTAEEQTYEVEEEALPQCFVCIDELQNAGVSATDLKVRHTRRPPRVIRRRTARYSRRRPLSPVQRIF